MLNPRGGPVTGGEGPGRRGLGKLHQSLRGGRLRPAPRDSDSAPALKSIWEISCPFWNPPECRKECEAQS